MVIKKTLSCLLFTFIFATTTTSAADALMIMAAGGESSEKDDTIFDESVKLLAEYSRNNPQISVTASVNGGHKVTERILRDNFPGNTEKNLFSKEEYERLIESYKGKIKGMNKGDQLMIFIDSHGAPNTFKTDKTHQIASSKSKTKNVAAVEGAEVVSLDELAALKIEAKNKGVKLAIIDASCHSGNTLALADENTCVISSTGPNHYGYNSFSQNFIKGMTKGRSLEEIFLETRKLDTTPAVPMISTKIGISINNLLYDKLSPFLYYKEKDLDKLTPFLEENNDSYKQCIMKENYNSLIDTINKIEELNLVTDSTYWKAKQVEQINLTKLKKLITNFHKLLLSGARKLNALGKGQLKNVETIKVKPLDYNGWKTPGGRPIKFSWSEMINTDYRELIELNKTMLRNEKISAQKLFMLENIQVFSEAQIRKEKILREHPNLLQDTKKEELEINNSIQLTRAMAEEIAREERILYAALYKDSLKTQSANDTNACQNFNIR